MRKCIAFAGFWRGGTRYGLGGPEVSAAVRNPEARFKATRPSHFARFHFTPRLNREVISRAKRPRSEGEKEERGLWG